VGWWWCVSSFLHFLYFCCLCSCPTSTFAFNSIWFDKPTSPSYYARVHPYATFEIASVALLWTSKSDVMIRQHTLAVRARVRFDRGAQGPSPAAGEPRPVLRRSTLSPNAIRSAIGYCESEGLLVKIFHMQEDGTFGVSSCGDYDYPVHDGSFFAACGEFPCVVRVPSLSLRRHSLSLCHDRRAIIVVLASYLCHGGDPTQLLPPRLACLCLALTSLPRSHVFAPPLCLCLALMSLPRPYVFALAYLPRPYVFASPL
jgi:hypothetical protein